MHRGLCALLDLIVAKQRPHVEHTLLGYTYCTVGHAKS